jgi:hypothetical protein
MSPLGHDWLAKPNPALLSTDRENPAGVREIILLSWKHPECREFKSKLRVLRRASCV